MADLVPSGTDTEPKTLADVLQLVAARMATDPRDWSVDQRDAFLYGVLVGWDCDEPHDHDEHDCTRGALDELAQRHGWPAEKAEKLRAMRRVVREAAHVQR